MAYMLFFKVRDLGEHPSEYALLLSASDPTFQKKAYLDEVEISHLRSEIERDEYLLYRKWTTPLNPKWIKTDMDEWELMKLIAPYNPKRALNNNYRAQSSWGVMLRDVLSRQDHLSNMVEKATQKLSEANEMGMRDKIELSDRFS